ncbi:NAD-P-binding protein [Trametes versicolor FP-101664 SS1]|uniref:NAD-P-binding protein n=1 Tax=Trametes versicolor (strain FP-101664) TaxID=717944 RepID=UPI00046223E5|nr:NAD-P-binding protein [Trametes versicolor FP-101664 SS1]EIW55509.1 NAD-P-binding protein [Trametes versicolor FP-101664 SS1]
MDYTLWLLLAVVLPVLLYFYVRANDAKLTRLPPEATAFSPRRWTVEDLERTAASPAIAGSSPSLFSPEELPPKTGRRYIVIGGAGFLGGWIVLHLIARGEDPRRIRIMDVRRPIRQDMLEGPATKVDFCQVDVTNAAAVEAAFRKPWVDGAAPGEPEPELTVFHTVAIIRFYERHPALQVYSDRVNVQGTRNVIDAARKVGAAALIYTSSGSVSVCRSRFWLWPWEREPAHFVQPIGDDDAQVPTRHEDFFSNYAVSKRKAEVIVRRADGLSSGNGILRTGCIRPGNAIYGPGGDLLVAAYLLRKANMTWIANSLQSFCYVENCSIAHLCYEQRLIELARGDSPNPDIGGQSFAVCDAGPAPTYGEINRGLTYLSGGACTFQDLSPTAMLALATLVEGYYLARHALLRAPAPFSALAKLVPALSGDIVFLQPSMWALTQVHLIFDDSRARASPSLGGLGYSGRVTTLEGTCKVFAEHMRTGGRDKVRVIAGHDSPDLALALARAEKSVEEVMEKLGASLDKPRVAELQY